MTPKSLWNLSIPMVLAILTFLWDSPYFSRWRNGQHDTTGLRVYDPSDTRVYNHYKMMRMYHTSSYAQRMHEKFGQFNHSIMTMKTAFEKLEGYVDASDPDLRLPNVVHAFMSAEAARKNGEEDWFQLTLLLHDIGKIMFLYGTGEDGQSGQASGPQWALGGDTWLLHEPLPSTAVFPELNILNPEHNTTNRLPDGLGIDNMEFPYAHDEYGYQFLKHTRNGCLLPPQALAMVRLHSCYPLHSSTVYNHLLKLPQDLETLDWVRRFNKYDLYSKSDHVPTIREMKKLWPYYSSLMDKYFERGSEGELYF
jgi:inositol oxygenase